MKLPTKLCLDLLSGLTLVACCMPFSVAQTQNKAMVEASVEVDSACVLKLVAEGDVDMSIGAIRARCQPNQDETLIDIRDERERTLFGDEFSILLHRDNYVLPVTHNWEMSESINELGEVQVVEAEEIKFQLSIKTMLVTNLPFNAKLFAAYTNQSHWQAYNKADSRPFRETNHQPELFLDVPVDRSWRGVKLNTLRFGLNHQSNGRAGLASRSWNRAYTELLMSTKHSELGLKIWKQISIDDDNPDIDDFMGNFQLEGMRNLGKHRLHLMVRNNMQGENRGAFEMALSRNIGGREDLRLYLQYFNGYGESLIDYNRKTERIGIGFKVGN